MMGGYDRPVRPLGGGNFGIEHDVLEAAVLWLAIDGHALAVLTGPDDIGMSGVKRYLPRV